MTNTPVLDLSGLSEDDQVAFFGALFAISAADEEMNESEDARIFESLDLVRFSANARERVLQLAIRPLPLERCLLQLEAADVEIKRGLMLNLIDVVLADDLVEPGEHVGLHEARQILGLSRDDVASLHEQAVKADRLTVRRPLLPSSKTQKV